MRGRGPDRGRIRQTPLRLMAITAHPDDESLALGGSLTAAAREGIETYVICATSGQRGRFREHPFGSSGHPGPAALGRIREIELRRAASVLGVHRVDVLGYEDGHLAKADAQQVAADVADRIREVRPDVVLTFDPYGAYGHPDHIAISQITTSAIMLAGAEQGADGAARHSVAKLYYIAWSPVEWEIYQDAFKRLTSTVDGVVRQATPWPEWAITTRIDTERYWATVWEAVRCHESQMVQYGPLERLSDSVHRRLWGSQQFYRALSLVSGGRTLEDDLFAGLRTRHHDSRPRPSLWEVAS